MKYLPRQGGRVIAWFSCGATSAVAAKLAISEFDEVHVVYQDTNSEHPDNARFLRDCEEWFGQPVEVLRSDKYDDIWDVFRKTKYLVGVQGARCTYELKRKLAEEYLNHYRDLEVFGYDADERERVEAFIANNPERNIYPILLERGLTKGDCLAMVERAGIELPVMYKLGYSHNNCLGCVKGQQGYWNKIRVDFPEVFDRMAKLEREIDVAINKTYKGGPRRRLFLDELDPDAGRAEKEPDIQCGILCEAAEKELNDE